MLDTKDLRGLSVPELKTKVEELKQSHSKEYVKAKVGSKSDKAINLRNIRKDVARVLTIITEKENNALKNEKKQPIAKKTEIAKAKSNKNKELVKIKKEEKNKKVIK